jgi:hypothetical protein
MTRPVVFRCRGEVLGIANLHNYLGQRKNC